MPRSVLRCGRWAALILAAVASLWTTRLSHGGQELDYSPTDPALKAVLLDRSPNAAFVGVRADTSGRVFVGGRESVFVYEPDGNGDYRPRREIYRFPPHSWVFDLEIRGEDLYALTASALYVLPGAVVQNEGPKAKRLIWGQPLGHLQLGFFGLAWGPEGDLYMSLGDPLQHYGDFNRPDHWGHWTFFSQPDGTRTPYTGVGGVLRCRPDGSGLQVVARGIFRSCGLAFDRHWNLFTDDNDREAMPVQYVPARLLHVTPRAYFSWPRGWMASKSPDRADLLETMYSGLGRSAPVGLAYYDETFLPARYRNSLLVARWAQRSVTRHPLTPRGASFKTGEHPFLVGREQARPVGVCVGRGGRLFATVLHMAQLEGSPKCPSDLVMITNANDAATHPFDAYDAPSAPTAKLWSELSNPSWWRRNRAHVEILRRGGRLLRETTRRLAKVRDGDPAIYHLPWLAGASADPEASRLLVELTNHSDDNVRLQAIRALAEFPRLSASRQVFVRALSDPNDRVRHHALLAFFNLDDPLPDELVRGPARSQDSYLRQSAALLLAERASTERLRELCRSDDAATRLAGVLAIGFRLTLPPATKPLPAHLHLSAYPDQACVIQFADAKLDLRDFGRLGNFTVAEHWKAGGHTTEQEQLFALLVRMLSDEREPVRLQAAHYLSLLNDTRSEPLVARVVTASVERRLAAVPVSAIKTIRNVWLVGPFPDRRAGLRKTHPPEQGPIDLAAEYPVIDAKLTWKPANGRYFDLTQLLGRRDHASSYAYCRLESPRRQQILLFVGSNDGVKMWHNGRLVWEHEVVRRALAFQDSVVIELQPGSNDLLVRVRNVTGDSGMYLSYKALGEVVATLPEKVGLATLADRLKAAKFADKQTIAPEFLETDWNQAITAGKADKGRKLFGSDALGCVKCHAIIAEQTGGNGPSLAEAGKRFTIPHLVESILLPNRNISPVFRASLIVTESGQQFTGLVVGETAEKLELILPDTTRKTILKNEIEARKLQDVSPMPQGIVKTPDELRDLLAYLLSENPRPP